MSRTVECPSCLGTELGELEYEDGYGNNWSSLVECTRCNGKGSIELQSKECTECGKEEEMEENIRICHDCTIETASDIFN